MISEKIQYNSGKILSSILGYNGIRSIVKTIIGFCNLTGIHKFDIYKKIPDVPATLAIRHRFSLFGYSMDIYLIAAASLRKVRGFIQPDQFKKPFFKPFLEKWGAIPAERNSLRRLTDVAKEDSLGFSIEGSSSESLTGHIYRTAAHTARYRNPLIPIKVEVKKGPYGNFFRGSTSLSTCEPIYVARDATKQDLLDITSRLMKELE